ncbi:uncharacterized protein BT62DRAFT_938368 [Guyanagaster necrorhizus]|uniref:Uncharacterized protein n=1 Tax=Guyanagaster necrorhizus TaxID=856835 RepID=A0A9P7VFU1_9AGAR|nr:uncharacterized protein BT62DRAFT_938368 [Guyanagaster necrorhizus MCA 3950]KAG7440161.1 hypothetical protein BT62DRAFT_938368 [Guyanagaster necrorhizus MCA 3950]
MTTPSKSPGAVTDASSLVFVSTISSTEIEKGVEFAAVKMASYRSWPLSEDGVGSRRRRTLALDVIVVSDTKGNVTLEHRPSPRTSPTFCPNTKHDSDTEDEDCLLLSGYAGIHGEQNAKCQRTSSPTSAFAEDNDTAAYIEDCQLPPFEVSISAEDNSRYGEVVMYAHYLWFYCASHCHSEVPFFSNNILGERTQIFHV